MIEIKKTIYTEGNLKITIYLEEYERLKELDENVKREIKKLESALKNSIDTASGNFFIENAINHLKSFYKTNQE